MNSILLKVIISLLVVLTSYSSLAGKVERDLKIFDTHVEKLKFSFERQNPKVDSKEWAKLKLAHMVEVDQYMRKFIDVQYKNKYNEVERKSFMEKFGSRWTEIDKSNTEDLKKFLQKYGWFKISIFGKKADKNAWLLVQHADHDIEFQKKVLTKLEKLLLIKETDLTNYAYLFDRVAVSLHSKVTSRQKYGTQGKCVAKGTWEPHPIEDPDGVDLRRESVGLEPLADYINGFKEICH